jgi:diguanylate cyclase (GGDEF)-like protein
MSIDRRVLAGGTAFIAFVLTVHGLTRAVSPDSAATLVDIALPMLEAAALVLTGLACYRNRKSPYRWTWIMLALWLAANLWADSAWGWYEVVLRAEQPIPSPADIGYLVSYPLAFLTVVFAAWKSAGRLRAVEGALDAMMFAIGAAGLAWPILLSPLLQSSDTGLQHLINFAYPMGDLLVIIAFSSLLLGSFRESPPRFLVAIWIAFIVQVVADSLYFGQVAAADSYKSGGVLDMLWALVFALAGIAALMGVFPGKERTVAVHTPLEENVPRGDGQYPRSSAPSVSRIILPYLALPLVAAMIWMQFAWYGSRWDNESRPLAYLGFVLVALLVIRQFVTLVENRRLNGELSELSHELGDRVQVLGDLTERLDELNTRANHLNRLRSLPEVMQGALELACSVTGSPAAWISLTAPDGAEPVAATTGPAEDVPEIGSTSIPSPSAGRRVQQVGLEARGETIGSIWLLRPQAQKEGPDLVESTAAHIATAIDNTKRFQEALLLAERDPLTGLLNHGGIHDRLAAEERRARKQGGNLSVVMMDLDDFKLLNDTYGHPAGDRVLAQVSEAINGVLRHGDLAGRVGGDEMMLVLPDTDGEGALRLAERLRETVSDMPFKPSRGLAIPVRLSYGIASYPADADTLPRLIGAADASLYASKQRGGDTISGASAKSESSSQDHGLRAVAGRLMDVVGARDHYTRRHSDHVVVHALDLGQALGLDRDSLETLRLAAMLHDVGKIGIRPRLLRKSAPLTPEETTAVRRHVDLGEAIIRDLPRVAGVLEAVHAHHERHDGSGYPVGLAGEDIPLLARILAVADAYSAMVVDRPYRKKLSPEQAEAELARVAGSQLDPELVELFVGVLQRKAHKDNADGAYAAAAG